MNVLEAINNRRSYRGTYKNIKVPRCDLEAIMKAGMAAPSGCSESSHRLKTCWASNEVCYLSLALSIKNIF